jgi:hypothetical protein
MIEKLYAVKNLLTRSKAEIQFCFEKIINRKIKYKQYSYPATMSRLSEEITQLNSQVILAK